MWQCRTSAAGDCRAGLRGGYFVLRTWFLLRSAAILHDGHGLELETLAARRPTRVEPSVFTSADGDLKSRLAMLGAAQLVCALEPLAQPIAEGIAAILDGDPHRMFSAGRGRTRREGSIKCQRATVSSGTTNS